MSDWPLPHTRYDISLIGVTLTKEEEADMMQAIEAFALGRYPEVRPIGVALWSARQDKPLESFNPALIDTNTTKEEA